MNIILYTFISFLNLSFKPSCKCLPVSVADNFHHSVAVFSGKVLKIDTLRCTTEGMENGHFYQTQLVSVLKNEVFKGTIPTDTIFVMTGIGGGDCGFQFEAKTNYLFYTNPFTYNIINSSESTSDFSTKKQQYFRTSSCDRTTDSVAAEKKRILIYLKQGQKGGA